MRHVHSSGFVSIDQLAEQYNVSPQTIRRDVNLLTEAGEIRRVHGGVDIPVQSRNLLYAHRSALHLGAKQCIAQLVADHIEDGASLAVSIGTTPELVVAALEDKSDLSIFTNNLNVAFLACQHPDWSVTLPGGCVRPGDRDLLGPQVEDFFARYCVDYGIFGVGGVAPDGGLLDFTEDEVHCRGAIQANCNAAYLAVDHSKFGRRAHVRGGDIASLDKVFCNTAPPPEIEQLLAKSNTQIVTPLESFSHV